MSNESTPTLQSGSWGLERSPTVVRVNDEDFNIPSPQRKIMLRRLRKALLGQLIPAPFWAAVQLCDLDRLDHIVQIACFSLKMMDIMADLTCALPFKWTVKPSPAQVDSVFPPASFGPPTRIAPVAIYAARERDEYKCVITGTRKVFQTAQIFPSGLATSRLQDDPNAPDIWRFVDMFWSPGTAERWKRAVFNNPASPKTPVNDCSNLICLRRDIRSAWTSGLFALRPVWISQDKKQMEIEFYWQPRQSHELYDMLDLIKLPIPTKRINSVDKLVVAVGTRGEPSYRVIESGHRFRMTTDNPEVRPLPSFDLLDMQWHFNRLVSLSAATTIFDDDDDDDYDDSSSVRTQSPSQPHPKQSSEVDNEDEILDWFHTPFSSDSPPESEFIEDINAPAPVTGLVEDINALMIGPLPGSDLNRSRNVSQISTTGPLPGSDLNRSRNVSQISTTGPLPGSDLNRSRNVSQTSTTSATSADSAGTEGSSTFVDTITGAGHLSIDF